MVPSIEPEEFLTRSSEAVVTNEKASELDEVSAFTKGEKREERRLVDPLELETFVNLSICCLLSGSKVMVPLDDETVRLRASISSTEIAEDSE